MRDDKNTPDGMSVEELAKLLRSTVGDITDRLRRLGFAMTADIRLDDDTVRLISGELRRLREHVAPAKTSSTDFWDMPDLPRRVNTQPTAGRHSTEAALIVNDASHTPTDTASNAAASNAAASDAAASDAQSRTRIPPRDTRPDAQRPDAQRPDAQRPAPRPLWSAATYRPQYRNALTNSAARRSAYTAASAAGATAATGTGTVAAAPAGAAPTAQQTSHKPELVTEYSPSGGLIKKVSVYRWPATYNFYEQFRRDAQRYFDADSGAATGETPPQRVEFFSYIPQYSQLSRAQLYYYLWWRSRIRAGEYPPADLSYVLLYIYEIINLPEKIPPQSGMAALCDVWAAYRGRYPRIDKYLVEWVADYGLMYGLPAPSERIAPFYSKVIDSCTLKEYYAGVNSGEKNGFAASLADFASIYRWRDSKFAQGEALSVFETHIAGAIAHILARSEAEGKPLFSSDAMRETKVSRDAFCGSLCAYNIKRRIDVEYMSFARSHELRGRLTEAVKYAENRVRAHLKIKSRLNASGIDADCRRWLDEYFDENLPSERRRKGALSDEAPDYEHLYDAPAEDGGIERARELELESWSVTDKLVATSTAAGCAAGCAVDNGKSERNAADTSSSNESDMSKYNAAGCAVDDVKSERNAADTSSSNESDMSKRNAAGCADGKDKSERNAADTSFIGEESGKTEYKAAETVFSDKNSGKNGYNKASVHSEGESGADAFDADAGDTYVCGEMRSDAIDCEDYDGTAYTGAGYTDGSADTTENENSAAQTDDSDPYAVFAAALDPRLRGALAALLDRGFAAYCREAGEFADALAAELNEAAVDATGDIVCEPDANGDITVVEDYESTLRDALGRA